MPTPLAGAGRLERGMQLGSEHCQVRGQLRGRAPADVPDTQGAGAVGDEGAAEFHRLLAPDDSMMQRRATESTGKERIGRAAQKRGDDLELPL